MNPIAFVLHAIAVALIFLALFGAIHSHAAIIGLAIVYLPGLILGFREGFWKGFNE